MMRKFLFVFALSLMTLGTSAQIQEGAKLDNRTATLDKGKGTDDQELTTGKVDLEAKNDLKKDSEKNERKPQLRKEERSAKA